MKIPENTLAVIYDSIPFSAPKLRRGQGITFWNKLLVGVCGVVSFCTIGNVMLETPIDDLILLLRDIGLISYLVSILANVWLFWESELEDTTTLEDVSDIDHYLEAELSNCNFGFVLAFPLNAIAYIVARSILMPIIYSGIIFDSISNALTVCKIILMKHAICKRIDFLLRKIFERDSVLESFQSIRKLLKYNDKVNQTYNIRLLIYLSARIVNFLESTTAFWKVYGLKAEFDCFERNTPILSVLAQWHIITILVSVSAVSEDVSNYAKAILWETDKKISMNNSNIAQREKMRVIMLELTHTSVEFTAWDLFTMNHSSITDACGFMISFMMVFVQFMK